MLFKKKFSSPRALLYFYNCRCAGVFVCALEKNRSIMAHRVRKEAKRVRWCLSVVSFQVVAHPIVSLFWLEQFKS